MALTGNELLQVQGITNSGLPSGQTFQTNTQAIADLSGPVADPVITTLSTVGAGTITAAGIVGQVTSRSGAQASQPFTDTTDTANNLTAAQTGVLVNDAFFWTYSNLTNAVATISAGSGVTVSVISVVPPNSFAKYLVTYTAVSTYTFVGVEQGYYAHSGTFTVTGATALTVADTNITTASVVDYTLKVVGGTVGAFPKISTITAGVGFTIVATTADTSIYNYTISG